MVTKEEAKILTKNAMIEIWEGKINELRERNSELSADLASANFLALSKQTSASASERQGDGTPTPSNSEGSTQRGEWLCAWKYDDYKNLSDLKDAVIRLADHFCSDPPNGKERDWPKVIDILSKEMKKYLKEGDESSDTALGKKKATQYWLARVWELRHGY